MGQGVLDEAVQNRADGGQTAARVPVRLGAAAGDGLLDGARDADWSLHVERTAAAPCPASAEAMAVACSRVLGAGKPADLPPGQQALGFAN